MRLFISLSLVAMLAVIALTACNSTDGSGARNSAPKPQTANTAQQPAPKTTPGDGARRVTVAELKAELDKGTAIVVDVRSEAQYQASHIKGALHIPEGDVAARSGELPRDKMIVTYCS